MSDDLPGPDPAPDPRALDVPRVVRPRRTPVPRRASRRQGAILAVVVALVVAATVTVILAGRVRPGGHDARGGDPPPSDSSTTSIGSSTSAPTTTTTNPPNDLLAPPPTVVPPSVTADGMAPLVRRVDTTDRVVFITIDDGNIRNPSYPDHLARLGVPFTSFLTQPMAKADPAYWKSMVERGGTIQTHTISHPNLRTVGAERMRREICEPVMTFTALFGARPTLFRPPYGNSSDAVRRVAAECGYAAVVLWTGSTNVGKLTMQDVVLKPGDIILMHYRDTLDADLDDLVARVRAEGFRIGRLEDYLRPQ